MQLESLQLRALARYACSKVQPPQTIEDVLIASILENVSKIQESGGSAVIVSSSNAGQSVSQSPIPGSFGPADVISALELLLEVTQSLIDAGVPGSELCNELIKRLVPPPKTIHKSYLNMTQ